jgi:hypothetical protein
VLRGSAARYIDKPGVCLARGPLRSWESERGPRSHTHTHSTTYTPPPVPVRREGGAVGAASCRSCLHATRARHWTTGREMGGSLQHHHLHRIIEVKGGKRAMTNTYRLIVGQKAGGGGGGVKWPWTKGRNTDVLLIYKMPLESVIRDVFFIPRCERNQTSRVTGYGARSISELTNIIRLLIILISYCTFHIFRYSNAEDCPRTSIQSLTVCCSHHVLINKYNLYVYSPPFQTHHSCFGYKGLYISQNVSNYDTGSETNLTSNLSPSREERLT